MPDRAVSCPIVYNTLDYDTTSDDPQFCGKAADFIVICESGTEYKRLRRRVVFHVAA
jgi:hypothetical protein